MADGFQGPGYFDANGNWVDTPGTGLNGMPAGQQRPITTPNSSTGQPAYADPEAPSWNSGFAQPQGGPVTLRTPNSSTGAPAAGPPTIENAIATPSPLGNSLEMTPPSRMPIGGLATTAIGALANAPNTPQGVYNSANAFNDWFNNTAVGRLLNRATGSTEPRWGPDSKSYLQPITQTESQVGMPWPPGGGGTPPPGPGNPLPPFNRGPVPAYLPQRGPASTGMAQQPSGGGGGGGSPQAVAAPPTPQNIDLGHYRATVGNARGNPTWVPGGEDAPAPQIFRGATTAWGVPNYGQGPRGSQNYYQPGSAPMAPGDWTGTGPAAGPFVQPGSAPTGNARGGGNPYGQTQRGAPPQLSAPFSTPPLYPTDPRTGLVVGGPGNGLPPSYVRQPDGTYMPPGGILRTVGPAPASSRGVGPAPPVPSPFGPHDYAGARLGGFGYNPLSFFGQGP